MFLFQKRESILTATNQERHDAIARLITSSSVHSGYYLLLILATLIVTPGILTQNTPVVIGGMILAPLLVPSLLLSLSLLNGTIRGCLEAVKVILLSILIAVGMSALLTRILTSLYSYHDTFTVIESFDAGIYMFIAFCSGIAAAFAWVKEDLAEAIAGVAVAVSLLPPLCIVGVGIAVSEYATAYNAFLIFMANLIGISAASYIVFLLLGFLRSKRVQEKEIKKNGKE